MTKSGGWGWLRRWMVKVERKRVNVARGRYQKTPLIFRGGGVTRACEIIRIHALRPTFSHVPLEIHSDRILLFQRLDEIFLDPLSRLKKKSTWKIVRINIPIILISKKDRERNDSFLFSCSIRGNKTIEKWWKKKRKNVAIRERNGRKSDVIHRTFLVVHVLRTGDKDRETEGGASERELARGLDRGCTRTTRTGRMTTVKDEDVEPRGVRCSLFRASAAVLILFRLFFGRLETFFLLPPSFLPFFVRNSLLDVWVWEERNNIVILNSQEWTFQKLCKIIFKQNIYPRISNYIW